MSTPIPVSTKSDRAEYVYKKADDFPKAGRTTFTCSDTLKKICMLISILVFCIIFYLVKLIYSSDLKSDLKENLIILEIKNNVESKLIYSFNISLTECEPDEEILTLGKIGGTSHGCRYNGEVKKGECPTERKKNYQRDNYENYENIPSTPPVSIKKINSYYICVKKSKETYKELLKTNKIISPDKECQHGYKPCGIIDTLGNIFCVKNEEICPININDIENIFSPSNSDSINRKNTQILSIFKLSEDIPCINPEETTWTYHYVLEPESQKCISSIKDKIYDNRYEQFTRFITTKYDLYSDNNIKNYNIMESKTEKVYLYSRNIIGFDIESIDKFNYQIYSSLDEPLDKFIITIYIIYILPLVSFLLPLFFIYGKTCRYFIFNGCCCLFIIEYYLFIPPIVSIICLFVDVILNAILYLHSSKIISSLDLKGSDEYTNELFQILINQFSANLSISLGNIISSCIVIIIFSLLIFFMKKNNYKIDL